MGSIANETGAVNFVTEINCHDNKIKMDKLSTELNNKVSMDENYEKLNCDTLQPDLLESFKLSIKENEKYKSDLDRNVYPDSNCERKDMNMHKSPVSCNHTVDEAAIETLQNTCNMTNETKHLSPINIDLIEKDALISSAQENANQLLNENLTKSTLQSTLKDGDVVSNQNNPLIKEHVDGCKVVNLCDTDNDTGDNECMICGDTEDIILNSSVEKVPSEDNSSYKDTNLKLRKSCSHIVCKQCREDYILKDPNEEADGNTFKCPFCREEQ